MNIDDIIENAQLKGRVIALDAEVKCLEAVIRAHERVDCLSVTSLKKQLVEADAENARLKAEVERLTKAGDELHAFLINYIVENRISSAYLNKLDDDWNAAKEGKQS
jgi:cell division protein FtsB